MAGLSDYGENLTLDAIFGSGSPATLYIALYTAAPTDAGGGTEVSGGSYARKAVTNNATNFPASSAGRKNLHVAQSLVVPTSNWGVVTHIGIFDASTSGHLLAWAPLTQSRTIESGNLVSINADEVYITLD